MNPSENPAPFDAAEEPQPILALSSLYLEIGLPLNAAIQSAIADLESISETEDAGLCVI